MLRLHQALTAALASLSLSSLHFQSHLVTDAEGGEGGCTACVPQERAGAMIDRYLTLIL